MRTNEIRPLCRRLKRHQCEISRFDRKITIGSGDQHRRVPFPPADVFKRRNALQIPVAVSMSKSLGSKHPTDRNVAGSSGSKKS